MGGTGRIPTDNATGRNQWCLPLTQHGHIQVTTKRLAKLSQ